MSTAIIWFRNDLRTADHEALFRAAENHDRVLPLYVIDKARWSTTWFGIPKVGARRAQFILESLADLSASLENCGAALHLAVGNPAEVIAALCKTTEAERVYAHKEVSAEETSDEEAVKAALPEFAELTMYWGATLTHINDLPMAYTDLPDVFTAFRKRVEKESELRALFPAPERLSLPDAFRPATDLPSLVELGYEAPEQDARGVMRFHGGATAAAERLNHYFWNTEKLAEYKHTRNGLLGADYSSKFSPWLACGCISPRTIYHEVTAFEKQVKKNQSTYWLVFELRWRDYFRFVAAKYGDKLFYPGGIRGERPEVRHNEALIEAWKTGKTGIPFVDANMIELNQTGFMSNRGRQNAASFFVKDLQQDWRIGAAWFENRLMDYDVASNWGNWAYVAGVGNDPREERYFNMLIQAARYDGKGQFVKHWIPELAHVGSDRVHTPWLLAKDEKKLLGIESSIYAQPVTVPHRWQL